MQFDEGLTNFRVYEGANNFFGIADLQLPDISIQGEDMSGAGISGTFASKFKGHVEAMTLAITFRSVQKHLIGLTAPRNHTITAMGSQQHRNNESGELFDQPVKYVMVGVPTKFSPGKLAPAAKTESAVEFSITYFAGFLEGKKMFEIDQINFIYEIDGVDYLKQVRENIGMN